MYNVSVTVDAVIDALAAFLTPIVGAAQIVRAQSNRVAMPKGSCVILTDMAQADQSVPYTDYDPDSDTAAIVARTRIDVQIDFYGPSAGDFCKATKAAFRSQWGFDQFPANVKPLYTSDGMQSPLTTGEKQYESRWTLTASLQYNPSVTVPQAFGDALTPVVYVPPDL